MAEVVKLKGARVALGAEHAERIDLLIERGRILPFESPRAPASELDLTGYLMLPGLINAHDHLEFNLFPRLGRGPYPNASVWADDIYRPEEPPVREHLLVPKKVRLAWGAIRNLLSGVTTVAHHNPHEPSIFTAQFPVRVVAQYGWAHSLAFSQDIFDLWNRTPARWPFIIHAAEGTDEASHAEISHLKTLGVLSRRTVLVHAVGTTPRDLEMIWESGASIVWCPTSNLFTLGCTVKPETLRSGISVALGTDSAITAEGDLIDEINHVRKVAALTPREIYPLVTTNAARVLRLDGGQGMIRERGAADLLAVCDTGQTPAEALVDLRPELVIVRGRTMLMSECFASKQAHAPVKGFHGIQLEGRAKCLVRADIPALHAEAAAALGPSLQLAGKRVCV